MAERVLGLLDSFEKLVENSLHLGWVNKVVMDEKQVYAFLQAIRQNLPGDLYEAQDILTQRDDILRQARHDAADTSQRLNSLVEQEPPGGKSRERVNRLLQDARREADLIRAEADDYVYDSLDTLLKRLNRLSLEVKNGMAHLDHQPRRQEEAG